ncbi:hypothetical protein EUTSA_v10000312mg [Eutrema salsugineum]|uniref:CRM domain-containing protein n=1 Tax=Eutrema salsugineum TaxID=72664 RepID=V4LQI8_EUTSA|nr:uncharacterized protein LOC18022058 [Eutrema salsugineum]ESQ46029.1 hypothetical protein EUTSA_v10000312mg [Eutrema salsugineum]
MATVRSTTLTYLIHRLLRHPKPKSPVYLILRSFSVLTTKSNYRDEYRSRYFFPSIAFSLPLPRPLISLSSLLVPKLFSSVGKSELVEDKSLSEKNDEDDYSEGEEEKDWSDSERTMVPIERSCERTEEMITESSTVKLSVKEKKKLASYAHSLGDKLKCQLVGKSGVTDSVVFSFLETLEKNELLKVKIHRTCPGTLEGMILHLEEATGSVAVGKIARTVILYRSRPTKLKAK